MREKSALFLIAASIVLFLFSIVISLGFDDSLTKKDYPFSFTITRNVTGFDVNGTSLTFGKVPMGSASTRTVFISNNYDFPIEIKISSSEEYEHFFLYEKDFILDPGLNRSVPITVFVLQGYEEGYYEGNISFDISKSR